MVTDFDEDFRSLDPSIWTASYLPAWSSRAASAATATAGRQGLVLSIRDGQPLWCEDSHPEPLRVSALQSANGSGPVGSTVAPQPFLPGQTVREEQPHVRGFAPHFGAIEVTCAATLVPGTMFSAWMVGLEETPERSGEICLVEVFGESLEGGSAAVGQGIHPFRDPALAEDFEAPRRALDVARPHRYGVDWRPGEVRFFVDGELTRTSGFSPDYPLMLILGLFEFPVDAARRAASEARLNVTRVRGRFPGTEARPLD